MGLGERSRVGCPRPPAGMVLGKRGCPPSPPLPLQGYSEVLGFRTWACRLAEVRAQLLLFAGSGAGGGGEGSVGRWVPQSWALVLPLPPTDCAALVMSLGGPETLPWLPAGRATCSGSFRESRSRRGCRGPRGGVGCGGGPPATAFLAGRGCGRHVPAGGQGAQARASRAARTSPGARCLPARAGLGTGRRRCRSCPRRG